MTEIRRGRPDRSRPCRCREFRLAGSESLGCARRVRGGADGTSVLAMLVCLMAAGLSAVLLRLAYLGVTNAFAMPLTERDRDAEILALRRQITVLRCQLAGAS